MVYILNPLETTKSQSNNMSLREVETLVRHLEIYQALTDKEGIAENVILGYCLLRIFAVFLFCFKPEISRDLCRGVVDVPVIASTLGKNTIFNQWGDAYPDSCDVITAMICLENHSSDDRFTFVSGEQQQHWESALDNYFRRGFRGHENYTAIICQAINTLKLGG